MIRAFISYSHVDESYRNELQKHLVTLQHQGLVETWHDRCIVAGEEWAGCIDDELRRADIILLLISSDFIASRYCYELEMKEALARHERKEAVVIPIILRSCHWTGLPFGKLQAATKDAKPIEKYPSRDDAFLEITQNIETIAKRLNKSTSTTLPILRNIGVSQTSPQMSDLPRSSNLAIPKNFSDYDKDTFVAEAFDFIARYFDSSLDELKKRNDGVTTRFEKVDTRSFEAIIYRNGKQVFLCGIWLGNSFGSRGTASITYSSSGLGQKSSFNESMSVKDNGNMLGLEPMGMGQQRNEKLPLTNQGAAEYYWSMFFKPEQLR
jgi:TIR domain